MVLSKNNLFRIKFTVGLLALVAVGMVGYSFYLAEKKDILDAMHKDTAVLSDTIKQSFKLYMLEGRRENTQSFMENVSLLTSIERIRVYDRRGIIRSSTEREEIGNQGKLTDPTCRICHKEKPGKRNITVSFTTRDGQKVLRNVNPIMNEPPCYGCHTGDDALLGVLMVDFSISGALSVINHFREATLFLLLSITMVFGVLIFLNQVVDYFQR